MKLMLVIDRIYVKEEINEEVLIELINSQSMQRLKDISQHGMPEEYYYKPTFTRLEHSLGVLILLRRLGADLKEQIVGLLHDVSHTAFSHLVDWVLGDPYKENFQDESHLEIIKNSELPEILRKYGYDYREIADVGTYSLLEREAPFLCADRIDYTLRDALVTGVRFDLELILKHLINYKGKIVFDSAKAAKSFSDIYVKFQREDWGGDISKVYWHFLSDILKEALHKKIIYEKDFWTTDHKIIQNLLESGDENIIKKIKALQKGLKFEDSSSSQEAILLKSKFRYIDPEILVNNELKRLSELSREYREIIEKEKSEYNTPKRVMIFPKELK